MAELGDADLYKEGLRRLHDYSLLYWYARLDWRTRHRLITVANEQDRKENKSPLWDNDTLGATLFMLITSPVYKTELMQIENAVVGRVEKLAKEIVEDMKERPVKWKEQLSL